MTAFVDNHKKIIFVHVPKTGGTTVTDCIVGLEPTHQAAKVFGVDVSYLEFMENGHKPAFEMINKRKHDGYFSFAVMRDPYDWLVSYFEFDRHNQREAKHIKDIYLDFDLYIEKFHHRLQNYWFCLDSNILVDRVIDFKNLYQSLKEIQERFDIKKPIRKLNRKKINYQSGHYNNPSTLEKAKFLLKDDIELYQKLFKGKQYEK